MNNVVIYGLSSNTQLSKGIAKNLGIPLGNVKITKFADGETIIQNETSVRGQNVFVVQSTSKPVNDTLMELLIFIDSLRRSSAKEINIIMPYFGYSRQDKKTHGRQPITAALIARLLEEAGANRIISFDLHSSQVQGFFKIPVDELKAFGLLGAYIKKMKIKDLVIVSPDHGGISRARLLAEFLDVPLSVIDKRRTGKNSVVSTTLLGSVENKNCIIYDDIVDTGGTILEAYRILKQEKSGDVYVAATHGILSLKEDNIPVIEKFEKAGIKNLIITNSIYNEENKFIKIVDISEPLAGVIKTHISNESITRFFVKKYNTRFFDQNSLKE